MAARRTKRKAMPKLTVRDLQQRAKTARITLTDDEIEPTLMLMNNTLEAMAALDSTSERTREPAVIFRP
jgi:hypothetical protein